MRALVAILLVLCACQSEPPPPPEPLGEVAGVNARTRALVTEARRRGLDRNDLIIDRRLVQKLEWAVELEVQVDEPTDTQLKELLAAKPEAYVLKASATFEQHFFDGARRADAKADAEKAVPQLLAGEPVTGDPWTRGHTHGATRTQISGAFGAGIAAAIPKLPTKAWSDPLQSPFGWHIIRVTNRTDDRTPPFEELRPRLREDWQNQKKREAVQKRLDEIATAPAK